jgi:hypothetical protein
MSVDLPCQKHGFDILGKYGKIIDYIQDMKWTTNLDLMLLEPLYINRSYFLLF